MQGNQTFLTNPEKADDIRPFTFDHSYWSSVRSDAHFASQEQVFADLGDEVLSNGASLSILVWSSKVVPQRGRATMRASLPMARPDLANRTV